MQETIFTKIIKGEIPCHKIYEDEHTFAFLDIHPATEGDTLVVHKYPARFVWDLENEQYHQLMSTVHKLARHYQQVSGKPYVNITVLGIDVPHNHVHLIPFTDAKEILNLGSNADEPHHSKLAVIAEKLRFND